jgi:hypothetical protein
MSVSCGSNNPPGGGAAGASGSDASTSSPAGDGAPSGVSPVDGASPSSGDGSNGGPEAGGPPDIDPDGVKMLFPTNPSGTTWRMGTQDVNATQNFVAQGVPNTLSMQQAAIARTEGNLRFWNASAYNDVLSSNGDPFYTARLHILASGGMQNYTWQNTPGYLSSERDVKNQEYTIYFRLHEALASSFDVSFKIRGGMHTDTGDGNLSSCILFSWRGTSVRFGKEIVHPSYDYINVDAEFSARLAQDRWFGAKFVSYAPAGTSDRVINQLYLDTEPFDAEGRPRNGWRLFAQYEDIDGVDTGRYSQVVNWGGWLTSFRSDDSDNVDFMLLSVREIIPPSE